MALVGGVASLPHLLHGHHHLHHVHVAEHLAQLGGGHARHQPGDILPVRVNVHQPAGHLHAVQRGGLLGRGAVDSIIGDKGIDKIEVLPPFAVHLHNHTVFQADGGDRVIRGFHRDDAGLRPFGDKAVHVHGALGKRFEPFACRHMVHLPILIFSAPQEPWP